MTIRPTAALSAMACAMLTALSTPAFAHGNHTHGHGTLKLVIDGNTLRGEFDFPLESLLGFDYPPRTAPQHEAYAALQTRLGELAQFVEPAAEAGCKAGDTRVTPALANADPTVDIDNIVYAFSFECARIEALQSVYFSAFRNHPGLKQLRVELNGRTGRKTSTVRPKFPALTF